MTDAWEGYTELARSLDGVRASEQARSEGERAGLAEMSRHAGELQTRGRAQVDMLIALSQHLRFRMPRAETYQSDEPVEPATGLARAAAAIDRADAEARAAAERGQRPALLPTWSPFGRAAAVYGAAVVVILLCLAVAFLRTGAATSGVLVLLFIPLLCFVAGYLTLRWGSQTRVKQAQPEIYTRFGLLTCFLAGPVVLGAVVAVSLARR